MTIDELRTLALAKRMEFERAGEDLGKINRVITFLSDDMCFLKVSINISIPMLLYLGVSLENVKDVYAELINAKNFKTECSVRKIIGK